MRIKKCTKYIVSAVLVCLCVQTLFSLKWIAISGSISFAKDFPEVVLNSQNVQFKKGSPEIRGTPLLSRNYSNSGSVAAFTGTRIINGSFQPSFSLSNNSSVSVTKLDLYNEFEYENFKLPEPKFPRPVDKELFYELNQGLELLNDTVYIKRRGVVEVIPGGGYSNPFLCGWPSSYAPMHTKYQGAAHYPKLCPLLSPEGNTFQHFLDGLLPKLIQTRDILLDPDMKVLLAAPRASDEKMIKGIIDRIGIKPSQIVWIGGGKYSADYMVASCITPPLHPILWNTARKLIGVHDQLQVPQSKSYVILLTRALSHNGGRQLLNKEEVTQFLIKRYGKDRVVVFKGGYSLNDSLSLFGNVSLMIGVHGGALYNLYFAPKSLKLLEVMPFSSRQYPRGLATTIFWSMAGLIGQEYWRLFVETSGGKNNLMVNITLLQDTLQKMGV